MKIMETTHEGSIRGFRLQLPATITLSTPILESECGQPLLLPARYLDRCRDAVRSILFETDARVLGVTSAEPAPAKAVLAAGIATVLAIDTGEPTVLVECDPEQPIYRKMLGIASEDGVADWLRGETPLHMARMQALRNAHVIPVGGSGNDVGATFYQLTQTPLVDLLRHGFQNVILNLPPVTSSGHSILATHLADRILLTAVAGESRLPALKQAVELLDPARVQGVVLTDFESRIPGWLRRFL